MADEPERMDEDLSLLRERRHKARCGRMYALLLEDLRERGRLPREQACQWLVAVLCALEVPLRPLSADDPRVWLPRKLQEAFQACPPRADAARGPGGLEGFLQRLETELSTDRAQAERSARLVFASLRACISEGEAQQVIEALPPDMRALWARPC